MTLLPGRQPGGAGQRSLRQNAQQGAAIVRRGVDVVGDLDVRRGGGRRSADRLRGELAARNRRLCLFEPQWTIAHANRARYADRQRIPTRRGRRITPRPRAQNRRRGGRTPRTPNAVRQARPANGCRRINSSGCRTVDNAPVKKSFAATVRRPPGPAMAICASQTTAMPGISAAGSA